MNISAPERDAIAAMCGINPRYLWQCMDGRRSMSPGLARTVEVRSRGRIRRWHLRTKDWHIVWPELVKKKGAPAPAVAEMAA